MISQRVPAPRAERAQSPAARLRSFDEFLGSKVERWHWPFVLMIGVALLVMGSMLPRGAGARGGQIRPKGLGVTAVLSTPPASTAGTPSEELQQQLTGCRTAKTDPVPSVDTNASLRALDAHTPEQRHVAQRYTDALSACTDFACLRRANALERAPGQFRFPHFLVIGFPKCATTSLYCHFIQHPQVQHPKEKESHLLTERCGEQRLDCPAEAQRHYVVDILNLADAAGAQFTKAAFEGSTHYVLEADWLAAQLAEAFPWLKLVISMRDPISQAIAMHLHNVAHGRPANCTEDVEETSIYHCIRRSLKGKSLYAPRVAQWIEHFPPERLHILQFENLTRPDAMAGQLQGLKAFLDLDPLLPSSELPLTNFKHQRGHSDHALGRYWVMKRWEVEHLVEIARNGTRDVVDLLVRHGHADEQRGAAWLANWEDVWRDNLSRCEEGRAAPCKVVVS